MNLDDAVGTIISRGFTERQARFLVLVARHSGVCVMRQYSAFAGVVFGHTTRRFFTKLERLGWVSTYDCARKRARIYHVRHRELYEAVGDAESRLRRPPTVPRALERIRGWRKERRFLRESRVGSAGNSSQRRYIVASRVRHFVCAK
jgi:hypothetical protein